MLIDGSTDVCIWMSGGHQNNITTKSDRVAQQQKNQYNKIIGTFQNVPTVQVKFSILTQAECKTKKLYLDLIVIPQSVYSAVAFSLNSLTVKFEGFWWQEINGPGFQFTDNVSQKTSRTGRSHSVPLDRNTMFMQKQHMQIQRGHRDAHGTYSNRSEGNQKEKDYSFFFVIYFSVYPSKENPNPNLFIIIIIISITIIIK